MFATIISTSLNNFHSTQFFYVRYLGTTIPLNKLKSSCSVAMTECAERSQISDLFAGVLNESGSGQCWRLQLLKGLREGLLVARCPGPNGTTHAKKPERNSVWVHKPYVKECGLWSTVPDKWAATSNAWKIKPSEYCNAISLFLLPTSFTRRQRQSRFGSSRIIYIPFCVSVAKKTR